MKRVSLSYPTKPKKQYPQGCDEYGNPYLDAFDMVVFAWKEDHKSMRSRMDNMKTMSQMHGH
jgi:hypothetical protein